MSNQQPSLNGNEERERVKKLIRDRVWELRKQYTDNCKKPAVLKQGNLAIYAQDYVLALEQNYVVQDVLIEAAGLSKKDAEKLLEAAGIPQKFIGG